MGWTCVPEAAVDEDGQPGAGEDHVPATAGYPGEQMVHAESQARPMQFCSESDLGRGVPAPLPGHPRRDGRLDRTVLPAGAGVEERSIPRWGRSGFLPGGPARIRRSEEHTSELQSRFDIVCRLLLEKR